MIMAKKKRGIGRRQKKTKNSSVISPQGPRHDVTHTVKGKRVCTKQQGHNRRKKYKRHKSSSSLSSKKKSGNPTPYWELEYKKHSALEESLQSSTSYTIVDSYKHCQATVVLAFVRLLKEQANRLRKNPRGKISVFTTLARTAGKSVAGGMPRKSGKIKNVSPSSVINWYNYYCNNGCFQVIKKGKWRRRNILREEEDVQVEAIKYLQINTQVIDHYNVTKKGKKVNNYRSRKQLKVLDFCAHMNNFFIQQDISAKGKTKNIENDNLQEDDNSTFVPFVLSERTALCWLATLGYVYKGEKKGFVDRHDDPDVIDARKIFCNKFLELELQMHHWVNVTVTDENGNTSVEEWHIDDYQRWYEATHGKNTFDRTALNNGKGGWIHSSARNASLTPIMPIYQDESIYRSKETNRKSWMVSGGESVCSKDVGASVMISGYVDDLGGVITLTADELKQVNELRKNRGLDEDGEQVAPDLKYHTTMNAFYYGKQREGYWNADLMVQDAIRCQDICRVKYPGYKFLFLFDHSTCHGAFADDALRVHGMNKGWGGTAHNDEIYDSGMKNGWYINANGEKVEQSMTFKNGDVPVSDFTVRGFLPPDDPTGYDKGVAQVLYERGLIPRSACTGKFRKKKTAVIDVENGGNEIIPEPPPPEPPPPPVFTDTAEKFVGFVYEDTSVEPDDFMFFHITSFNTTNELEGDDGEMVAYSGGCMEMQAIKSTISKNQGNPDFMPLDGIGGLKEEIFTLNNISVLGHGQYGIELAKMKYKSIKAKVDFDENNTDVMSKWMLVHRLKKFGKKVSGNITKKKLSDMLKAAIVNAEASDNDDDEEEDEEDNNQMDEDGANNDDNEDNYEWKDYSQRGLQLLLSKQEDFASEKSMLQIELEKGGDHVLFLPKFHCELNMIELIWGRSKYFVRREHHPNKGTLMALVGGKNGNPKGLIWTSFEQTNLPLTLVWKYAAKARDFIRLYDKEIETNTIIQARKFYKTHRRVFKTTEAEVNNFQAVEWTKLNVVVAFNGFQQ